MSKHKRKSENQARNDWVRRRQNIERGMKIALYEINQVLAPLDLHIEFGQDFIDHTVAVAEGGRVNASNADKQAAFVAEMTKRMAAIGVPVYVF